MLFSSLKKKKIALLGLVPAVAARAPLSLNVPSIAFDFPAEMGLLVLLFLSGCVVVLLGIFC